MGRFGALTRLAFRTMTRGSCEGAVSPRPMRGRRTRVPAAGAWGVALLLVLLGSINLAFMASDAGAVNEKGAPLSDPPEGDFGVQHEPKVHLIFWGENFTKTATGREVQSDVEALFNHLTGSALQGILTQYFDSEGRISSQVVSTSYNDEREHKPAPENLTPTLIAQEVESAAKAKGWPIERNSQFMVLTPPGTTFVEKEFADIQCGYHNGATTTSGPLIWSWVPYEGDGAIPLCEQKAEDPTLWLEATTSAAVHEYAESATDPMPGQGWVGEETEGVRQEEVADLCQTGFFKFGEVWTQPLYDDRESHCELEDLTPAFVYAVSRSPACTTATSATLSGTVNAEEPETKETVYYFEYGTTASYGSTTPHQTARNRTNTEANQVVSGLAPQTTYHYRVVAETTALASGKRQTAHGIDQTLTTAASSATTPMVTEISPRFGANTGASAVTISGANFTGTPSVHFGSALATGVEVKSSTSLVARSPSNELGRADVTVTTGSSTSPTCPGDRFTYIATPAVTKVEPNSGPEGTHKVTIRGEHFTDVESINFGVMNAKSFAVISSTEIVAEAPLQAGRVDVTVTNPVGTSPLVPADQFSYIMVAPQEGFRFKAEVPQSSEMTLNLGGEPGFAFGPLKASAHSQGATIEVTTPEPAFEETTPHHYRGTGGGINVEVAGYSEPHEKYFEKNFGPIEVACSVPASFVLAEIPYRLAANPPPHTYTKSYEAECVLAPGVLDEKQTMTVTMTATGPEWVSFGGPITFSEAHFTLTLPRIWRENLYGIGSRQVRGTAKSSATAVEVG